MKIRSRGLGKRELQLDLREFKVTTEAKEVVLSGVTHAPVTWETNIRVRSEDIGAIIKIALNPKILKLVVRWVFRLKTPDTGEATIQWEKKAQSTALKERLAMSNSKLANNTNEYADELSEA
jgi:hypothetical protein